ncbi:MAG: hypothetical protein LBF89_05580 [Bacteroidales bacterium]|nr:hypothetical protein [Bacteroidales bacterium]
MGSMAGWDYQSIIAGAGQGTVGILTGLYGAYKAKKEKKKIEDLLNQQKADNQAWYNANALGDYTQRADAQNLLRNLRENLDRQNKITANTAVVTGATPEQQAVQKEQANKVIADTYANLGAMGQQYKDKVTDQYLNRKYAIENGQMGMMNDSLNNYSTLFNNSMTQLADSFKTSGGGGKGGLEEKSL